MNYNALKRYACGIQKKFPQKKRVKKSHLKPNLKKVEGIKAVLTDIYGTFFSTTVDDLSGGREEQAFKKTVREFGLPAGWKKVKELYYKEIEKEHCKKKKKGIREPEVLIEKIWAGILREIGKKGVDKFKIAYYFDRVRDPNSIYPNALPTLQKLREQGIKLGIVSNSQFYTIIDMDILLRKESNGKIKRWQQLFSPQLCTFSFKAGFSKPNSESFAKQKKKFGASEMVFIGNDMLKDIATAKKAGLKAILFAGDRNSLRLHMGNKRTKGVKPDTTITDWQQLLKVID